MKMKAAVILVTLVSLQVAQQICKKGEKVKLKKGLQMVCKKGGKWEPKGKKNRAGPGGPPCTDSLGESQCLADRGHCNQFTDAGAHMDKKCPGTCGSCDGCRCQDSSQWHQYCPYWAQYCNSPGVMGTWMGENCKKTCKKCQCKCCSYKGKSHQLGESILLPEQCGELVCEEGLVAEDSPLLAGAVHHNVTHPEELTLVFRPLHSGYGCCMIDNTTMVAPGWVGELVYEGSRIQASCCHGSLATPIKGIKIKTTSTTTSTTTTTTTTTTKITTTSGIRSVVLRFATEFSNLWRVGDGYVDALDFVPSKDITIRGISLHRSSSGSVRYTGLIRLKEDSTKRVIATINFNFLTDDSKTYIDQLFSSPAKVGAGVKYTITLAYDGNISTLRIWRGDSGRSSVSVGCGGETVTFQFSNSDDFDGERDNSSQVGRGQIPRILFSC